MRRAGWIGRHRGRITTAGAAAGLVLVMALSSMASATLSTPPYKGWTTSQTLTLLSDCATGKVTTKAGLNLHTGNYHFAGSAKAATCKTVSGSVGSDSVYEVSYETWLGITEHFTTGYHNLSLNFTAAWNASGIESASGSCPTTSFVSGGVTYTYGDCAAFSEYEVLAYPYIQDNTNGSQITQYWCACGFGSAYNFTDLYYFYSGGTWTSYNYTYATSNTNYTQTMSGLFSVPISGYFLASHSYTLIIEFEVFDIAEAEGFTHASATVAVNAAGPGNGLTLNSIYIA